MGKGNRRVLWTTGAALSIGLGLVLGAAAGATFQSDQGQSTPPATEERPERLQVPDGDGLVGYVNTADLSAPPIVVDGEQRESFYPDVGWKVRNNADDEVVGYFVPSYGFLTPEEAERFKADPSSFEPFSEPAPPGAELPEGFDTTAGGTGG